MNEVKYQTGHIYQDNYGLNWLVVDKVYREFEISKFKLIYVVNQIDNMGRMIDISKTIVHCNGAFGNNHNLYWFNPLHILLDSPFEFVPRADTPFEYIMKHSLRDEKGRIIALAGESKMKMMTPSDIEKLKRDYLDEIKKDYNLVPKKKYTIYKLPSNRMVLLKWHGVDAGHIMVYNGEVYRSFHGNSTPTKLEHKNVACFCDGVFSNIRKGDNINTIRMEDGVGELISIDSTEIISYFEGDL